MATAKLPPADFTTLANLHAALDSVVEIEALIETMRFSERATLPARRLRSLTVEMRELLRDLLQPPRHG
jgi:hypothetical protein